jgi:hypothetical protein
MGASNGAMLLSGLFTVFNLIVAAGGSPPLPELSVG